MKARASRRLALPRPIHVRARGDGVPAVVGPSAVDAVREDWVVEDRWWTGHPLCRRYFELVLEDGRNCVVFHELGGGSPGWFAQRG